MRRGKKIVPGPCREKEKKVAATPRFRRKLEREEKDQGKGTMGNKGAAKPNRQKAEKTIIT